MNDTFFGILQYFDKIYNMLTKRDEQGKKKYSKYCCFENPCTRAVHKWIFVTYIFNVYSELSSRTHGVTVIGVGSLSFKGDNRQEVASSILTTGE